MLTALERRARELCKWLALLGLVGLVALAIITIADVMMRWLFSSPIDGVSDVYRLLIAIVVASFFPASFAERGHIAIRFLAPIMSRRGRKALAVLAASVTLAFTVVLGWQFILYSREVYTAGETTWLLGLNVTPWWSVATAFLLLCIPIQLIVVLAEAATSENAGAARDAIESDHPSPDRGHGV
jgi:TRAP-type C4-dicarboxylate transport system permease small subunit